MTEPADLLTDDDGRAVLRFERRLRHDPVRVWRAITEPEELAAWFPASMRFAPRPGAEIEFGFGEGEVVEIDAPRVLAFTWGGDDLRFELTPDGDGTLLVFTHAFVSEAGRPARDAAGWEACLVAFEALLDGREAEGDWEAANARYVERFGALEVDGRTLFLAGPFDEDAPQRCVPVKVDGSRAATMVLLDGVERFADGAPVEVRADGEVLAAGPLVAARTSR